MNTTKSDDGIFAMNIADILILLCALSMLGWIYKTFWFNQPNSGNADRLIVQVMKHAPQYYSLQQDQILKIKGAKGTSLVEISKGKVRFIHSSCRNKLCVLHGWLTTPGESIACLPNRVSLLLESDQNEFDALNY